MMSQGFGPARVQEVDQSPSRISAPTPSRESVRPDAPRQSRPGGLISGSASVRGGRAVVERIGGPCRSREGRAGGGAGAAAGRPCALRRRPVWAGLGWTRAARQGRQGRRVGAPARVARGRRAAVQGPPGRTVPVLPAAGREPAGAGATRGVQRTRPVDRSQVLEFEKRAEFATGPGAGAEVEAEVEGGGGSSRRRKGQPVEPAQYTGSPARPRPTPARP